VGHGLTSAAVALLDSIRIPTKAPSGWVTAQQLADYLGISKNNAVKKINRMGWKRMLVQSNKMPPTYYYGPNKHQPRHDSTR
jgi:Fic family protein